jgi:SAM-dependent methyltransferase
MTTPDAEVMTARVALNYSASADGYAESWSPVIRPAGRRLLAALPWGGATRILDVGTGTGALIPDILSRAPAARVVGLDPSLGMLAHATATQVPLVAMNAMALGVRPGTFDIVVLAFVLFHVADPAAALTEVRRVLRRGGTVGIATWAEEPATPATQIWDEELTRSAAWDPRLLEANHEAMNSPDKVRQLLDRTGYTPNQIWVEGVEHRWSVPRFIGFRMHSGVTKRKLETLDPPMRQACLDRIGQRMAGLSSEDLLCRGTAICATAGARP